ncbi:hypothetical protein XELAEV_18020481mg [Xenopus laevis]|uniref:Uncharacterized protein n=1 Tax=Xenopus laevis TaxID=8355 RepID=A0A974HQH9_XENLA|nr:hypothetical protein XELAEV_18020481mg [Xenopus laevis]
MSSREKRRAAGREGEEQHEGREKRQAAQREGEDMSCTKGGQGEAKSSTKGGQGEEKSSTKGGQGVGFPPFLEKNSSLPIYSPFIPINNIGINHHFYRPGR